MLYPRSLFRASALFLLAAGLGFAPSATPAQSASTATSTTQAGAPGVPFTADHLQQLLPPSVYFQGRSATLQVRNAGGTTFPGNDVVWAALVDTSGYATDVKEKYQFYLVTEGPLRIGDHDVPAGAYGMGFIGNQFVLLDIGGHQIATGATQEDAGMRRPRPLQVLPESATSVKLYLGRRWVTLRYAGK